MKADPVDKKKSTSRERRASITSKGTMKGKMAGAIKKKVEKAK